MDMRHWLCTRCGLWFDKKDWLTRVACPNCDKINEFDTTATAPETTTDRAVKWLYDIADMLKEKGRKYGNSLDNPVRIFSKAEKTEGLAVRIDDKLARIRASEPDDTEDAEADLVGYIALRRGLRDDS